jgi:rhamnosyltransferase
VKVHAVVVCFHPQLERVRALGDALAAAGVAVVLVDNTEQGYLQGAGLPGNCALVALGANTGIAHAQNVGIAQARRDGAQVIIFFDQDSMPDGDFVSVLIAPLKPGVPGVVGPRCHDEKSGLELPATRLNRMGLPRPVFTAAAAGPVPVDIIIASGSAATVETFDVAGTMDEAFFIDFVDTEWCLRCRSRNVPVTVVPGAVMAHTLGSRSVRVGPLTVLVHSPLRCYYQIRNCFLLFRRTHVPWLFALREAFSVIFGRILLLLFVPNRWAYLRAYLAAFRDGLRGAAGKRN